MRSLRAIVFVVLLRSAAFPSAVAAQDKGDTGVTMGYPASIGIVHHVGDRFAIRPELTFAIASGDSDTGLSTAESDTWLIGAGVSGIFYLRQWDKVRSYFSPRYTYSRGETTTTSSIILPLNGSQEATTTSSQHAFAGSFGAQFAAHDKFSVFGEVGLGYTRQRSHADATGGRSTAHQLSTRTGVGVIFYF